MVGQNYCIHNTVLGKTNDAIFYRAGTERRNRTQILSLNSSEKDWGNVAMKVLKNITHKKLFLIDFCELKQKIFRAI